MAIIKMNVNELSDIVMKIKGRKKPLKNEFLTHMEYVKEYLNEQLKNK